jgi:hypothetical protein
MLSESHLFKLAYLLTVGDVCTPFLHTFDGAQSAYDVWKKWLTGLCVKKGLDPTGQIALVTTDGKVEGWVGFDMLDEDKLLIECMETIKPDAIMSSNTSLINAIKSFSESTHPFFLILHEKCFKGWLPYRNLHTSSFQYCLLGMLITLEQTMLGKLLSLPNKSVKCLPTGRLSKAKGVYEIRNYNYNDENEPYASKLLECTTFIDKFTILRRLMKAGVIKEIPALEDKKFCLLAEKLRNKIAHPGLEEQSYSLLPQEMLWCFIDWIEKLEHELISIRVDV